MQGIYLLVVVGFLGCLAVFLRTSRTRPDRPKNLQQPLDPSCESLQEYNASELWKQQQNWEWQTRSLLCFIQKAVSPLSQMASSLRHPLTSEALQLISGQTQGQGQPDTRGAASHQYVPGSHSPTCRRRKRGTGGNFQEGWGGKWVQWWRDQAVNIRAPTLAIASAKNSTGNL